MKIGILALGLFSGSLFGDLIDVTLTLSPSTPAENSLQIGLSAIGFSDSDISQLSGTVQARIEIDPASGEISTLELVSADISGTPVTLAAGTFLANFSLATSTLGGTLNTPAPPAPVTEGNSPAELHDFTINSGTLTGSASGLLTSTIPVNEDFSQTPATGAGTVGTFVSLVSSPNAPASSATLAVYDLIFTYPIAITQEVEVGIPVTITANGTAKATGQVSLPVIPPNPYLIWAAANGLAEAPFAGKDFDKQLPNGLFWALGFSAGETPDILKPAGEGHFSLTLPSGGTATEVTVQTTTNLADAASWVALPGGEMSGSTNPIPSGTSGVLTIAPAGASRFYRLLATDPAE